MFDPNIVAIHAESNVADAMHGNKVEFSFFARFYFPYMKIAPSPIIFSINFRDGDMSFILAYAIITYPVIFHRSKFECVYCFFGIAGTINVQTML